MHFLKMPEMLDRLSFLLRRQAGVKLYKFRHDFRRDLAVELLSPLEELEHFRLIQPIRPNLGDGVINQRLVFFAELGSRREHHLLDGVQFGRLLLVEIQMLGDPLRHPVSPFFRTPVPSATYESQRYDDQREAYRCKESFHGSFLRCFSEHTRSKH
jgi:hypothetical protein